VWQALAGAVLIAATACAPVYRNHGYVPTDEELALLTVGVDTQDSVAGVLGRPSAAALLSDDGWFYVQSRFVERGARAPKEIDRQLVAITFDEDGVLANVERFTLEDGRVVTLSRRVTDTNVKPPGLLSQLLRNFGRITLAPPEE
jgi:outer membrane protein assembly factor BamE (lipoprotein component of BamABCDE complex)